MGSAPPPAFFITFFLYRHHRPAPQSVRSSSDIAPSRSPPVSRDGRISGFEFFTALCQHMAPANTPAKARQIEESHSKSNVLNILTITALLSSTSLISVGGVPPHFFPIHTPPKAIIHQRIIALGAIDRKSTRLNSSHLGISYAVFCLKKK